MVRELPARTVSEPETMSEDERQQMLKQAHRMNRLDLLERRLSKLEAELR